VSVRLGGRAVLESEGDPLRASTRLGLAAGAIPLEVRFEHTGPGPRLRLGWTRPDGRRETIPPRYLGPKRSAFVWWLTDALAIAAAALVGLVAWRARWDVRRAVPSPRPVTAGEILASSVGYLLLLTVMSWPLVKDLAHTGPMDRPDGRLNAWILAWAGPTLFTHPSRLFDAPAFHPSKDVLAFSENLLLPAAVVAPLQWASGPVLAYNVALVLSLLLSGSASSSWCGARPATASPPSWPGRSSRPDPHRWTRLSHLHAQVTVFFPLALLALDRFWESRTLRRALVVGLLLALQGLSSIYLGAITATGARRRVLVAVPGRP
jgi:hypothetical protein